MKAFRIPSRMLPEPDLDEYKCRLARAFGARTEYDDDYTLHRAVRLVECAQLRPGQKVLDVATGTGIAAIAAAADVGPEGTVVGFDISRGLLAQARRKVETADLRKADAERIELEDGSFDAVLCSSALMWLIDIPAALARFHRWLAEGGVLGFSCYTDISFMIPAAVRACARFGLELPNCNEPLGSSLRCRNLLTTAGFDGIVIESEQLGGYLTRERARRCGKTPRRASVRGATRSPGSPRRDYAKSSGPTTKRWTP